MAKTKVFSSYDYKHDLKMKTDLIAQSKRPDSPFSINDCSLNEKVPDWQQKARKAIESCDVFVVLLRENTHQSSGVKREVKMARQINKRRFQLHEQKHKPKPIKGGGEYVEWTWENLKSHINKRQPKKRIK